MERAEPRLPKRVVLTGFMGSGKSTVGRLLAQRLAWPFLDLDSAVEQRCKQPVPEIFAQYGEAHFRAEEAAALYELMQQSELVIALGGGAVETLAIRTLLQGSQGTAVIFLEAPFSTLHERCSRQAAEPGATARPLFAELDSARMRYAARLEFYSALATFRVNTLHLSPDQAAAAILQQLATTGHRTTPPSHLS